jgi:hypothetical protein
VVAAVTPAPQTSPDLTRLLAAPGHTARVIARARRVIDWAFSDRTCCYCGSPFPLVVDTCGLRCLNQAACDRRAEMREAALRGEPVQIPMGEVA